MHKSKGQEWKTVFVIDVNYGTVPHKSNTQSQEGVEEERRLLYVAMTRAKDTLYVICSEKNSQSPFMMPVLDAYRRFRIKKGVSKLSEGDKVKHKKFGIGFVSEKIIGSRLIIDFMGEEKKFIYPDAILDGYLQKID